MDLHLFGTSSKVPILLTTLCVYCLYVQYERILWVYLRILLLIAGFYMYMDIYGIDSYNLLNLYQPHIIIHIKIVFLTNVSGN